MHQNIPRRRVHKPKFPETCMDLRHVMCNACTVTFSLSSANNRKKNENSLCNKITNYDINLSNDG